MGGCRVSVSWGSGASAARLGSDAARGGALSLTLTLTLTLTLALTLTLTLTLT